MKTITPLALVAAIVCCAAPNAFGQDTQAIPGHRQISIEFKGGTLAAFPFVTSFTFSSNQAGGLVLPWLAWPSGLPSGFDLYVQYGIADPAGPFGASLSNAVHAVIP